MTDAAEVGKSIQNVAKVLGEFLAALSQVFGRKPAPEDEKFNLSPDSQRIQDASHSGDHDTYNRLVAENLRKQGKAPNGKPLTAAAQPLAPSPKATRIAQVERHI